MSLRRSSKAGFTLLELLISIIIVGIIISGLLYLVVEMLQLDRREFVLNQVSTDMNRAMDYIASDVEEAIYVYSTPTDIISQLSSDIDTSTETPILAFWRPEVLDQDELNTIEDCDLPKCRILKKRQAFLTLVVYLQESNEDSPIWNGETRIVRYELPNYTSITSSLDKVTPGYADPTLDETLAEESDIFKAWKADGNTEGTKQVLVDSVDVLAPDDIDDDEAECPSSVYERSPTAPSDGKSFYVCVPCRTQT
ncbi:MAG: prepilin-type N-terminal cleavage/methylation domain-containing protein, partial [Leptolyngbya sp. SIO4C5]|nr:prepilin-type N-terminal cleavage/methylation domain-containing protein [Leptolyngbya sp. SIO4C5]